jgi:hypothetical protein
MLWMISVILGGPGRDHRSRGFFSSAGHEVRVVKRSPGGIPSGAQPVLGDASDLSFCIDGG